METLDLANVVVGSGPSGAAASTALLARGARVTMIDLGADLPADEARRVAGLRPALAAGETPPDLGAIKRAALDRAGDLPLKLAFGADYPYRDGAELFAPGGMPDGAALVASQGRGGLSAVWGANILRYRDADLGAWPIKGADLEPHYAAVERLMARSGVADALEPLFPGGATAAGALPLGSQAAAVLRRLEPKRARLGARGVHVGRARLAVDPACVLCGNCLFGCPFGYIYSAAATVARLLDDRRFDYRPGLEAVAFAERGGRVEVVAARPGTGERVLLRAERLFVAAGVVPTALIVLASLPALRAAPVAIRDSQYFLVPALLRFPPEADPAAERLHTLSQLFFELVDDAGLTCHVELKTYNEFLEVQLRRRLGRAAGLLPGLVAQLARRVVVATGFLHSDYSAALALRFVETARGGRLEVTPRPNPATPGKVRAEVRRLRRAAWAGGLAVLPNTTIPEPGRSFHYGGTFPMAAAPGPGACDTLGRPAGLTRVHLVDASVFPSIPATTITLPVMANAHRLATTTPLC